MPTRTPNPRDGRPRAVPGAADGLVLYDGVCLLCSAWFRFVVERDPAARFRFAAVQGVYGRDLAVRLGIDPTDPETNAVILDGIAYLKSDAALAILTRLPGWSWCRHLRHVPRPVRDFLYDRIARNRYRLFGRTDACMIPDATLRLHLIDDGWPAR